MKTSIAKLLVASLLLAAFVASPGRAVSGSKRLVVIVAKGSSITNISHSDLKRAFLSDQVALGGRKLCPFNFNSGMLERTSFDEAVLGMSPSEVGRFWVDRKVRGETSPPRSLPSTMHMAKVVAKFPGAIGYLPEDQLTAEVQAVAIDGVLPSAAAYPLLLQ